MGRRSWPRPWTPACVLCRPPVTCPRPCDARHRHDGPRPLGPPGRNSGCRQSRGRDPSAPHQWTGPRRHNEHEERDWQPGRPPTARPGPPLTRRGDPLVLDERRPNHPRPRFLLCDGARSAPGQPRGPADRRVGRPASPRCERQAGLDRPPGVSTSSRLSSFDTMTTGSGRLMTSGVAQFDGGHLMLGEGKGDVTDTDRLRDGGASGTCT